MKRVEWNNKQGSRDRQAVALIVTPDGGVYEFKGEPIQNVCHAQRVAYEKAGKWSNTTFLVTLPDEAKFVSFREDWDTGRVWPQTGWDEAFKWLQSQAPKADRGKFETFIRAGYPNAATRFDEQKKADEGFSSPQSQPPAV